MWESLTDIDRLTEANEKHIAEVELALFMGIIALGSLLLLGAVILPTLARVTDNEKT